MSESATQFVWNLPSTEEDIRAIIGEIFRQHSIERNTRRVNREELLAIRDNLQFLVTALTEILEKK